MKHFTLRALEGVCHPIYGATENMESIASYSPRTRVTEGNLRLALEKAMTYRQTRWFLVDEAHHLLLVPGEEGPANILDSLKCLGNTTGAVIGLFGGYKLLEAGLQSAHLNGRLRIIHFPPYMPIELDIAEFDRIIDLIDRVLPRSAGFSLLNHRDAIYHGSVGCAGLLRNWADAALVRCIAQRDTEGLTEAHFRTTRFEGQMAAIRDEIKTGLELLERVKFDADVQEPCSTAPAKPNLQKPFTRKPKRDLVEPIA